MAATADDEQDHQTGPAAKAALADPEVTDGAALHIGTVTCRSR